MSGLKICDYKTIRTEHAQGSQWRLITHKECILTMNSSLCISMVAFLNNISPTKNTRNEAYLTSIRSLSFLQNKKFPQPKTLITWCWRSFLFQRTHLFLKRSQNVCCMDRATKNTPTHPAWSMKYARNNIRELSPRRRHKAKMVALCIVDEMMVKRFERL